MAEATAKLAHLETRLPTWNTYTNRKSTKGVGRGGADDGDYGLEPYPLLIVSQSADKNERHVSRNLLLGERFGGSLDRIVAQDTGALCATFLFRWLVPIPPDDAKRVVAALPFLISFRP